MGREIKRVALDFAFPLGETWTGYLNPHHVANCPACDGRGSHASAEALDRLVHLLMIAGRDSMERPVGYDGRPTLILNYPGAPYEHRHHHPHPWIVEAGITDVGDRLHELTGGLAGRAPRGPFGHDSCDSWAATRKIIRAAGLPKRWGHCVACKGSGEVADTTTKRKRARWRPTEPPAGDGWQLWQTVSEGGPVSPVFATPEELARWICSPGGEWGKAKMTYDAALAWVRGPGWALSFITSSAGLQDGIVAGGEAALRDGPTP